MFGWLTSLTCMASRDQLCYACSDIFSSAYDLATQPTLSISHTKWTFITSVKEGCRLCRIICHSLYGWIYVPSLQRNSRDLGLIDTSDTLEMRCSFETAFRNPDERNDRLARLLSEEVKRGNVLQIHYALHQYNLTLQMNVWNENASDKRVSLIINPLLPNSLEALIQSRLTTQDQTASDENFELISRWLQDCENGHACSIFEAQQPIWSPSRLIDVSMAVPRLVDTNSPRLRVPYLALSHCWGVLDLIKTEMASLEQFKIGNPLEACPATFRDAFHITRRLGHRCVWIDSLCILQDSSQDWQVESGRMSDVYGHSSLNLIAAHARDGTHGCFSTRDIRSVRPCRVPNPFRPVSNESFIIYPMRMDKIYDEQIRNSPIYQRAWVLQERLLSPRSVYFGKEQVFWACGEFGACEAFPSGANYVPTRPHNEFSIDKKGVQQLLNPRLTMAVRENQGIAESWPRIVKMYSSSHLTYVLDKLSALSGIAERVHSHIGGEYLAGLWNTAPEAFLWSLLWFVDSHDKGRQRPHLYCAPSWTWTSVNGTIEMTTPDPSWRQRPASTEAEISFEMHWHATLHVVHIIPEHANPYGRVIGGTLVLRGSPKTAHVQKIVDEDVFGFEFFDAELYAVRDPGQTSRSQDRICSCHIDVPSEIEEMTEVMCLPVVEEKEQRGGRLTGLSRVHGLIIDTNPQNF